MTVSVSRALIELKTLDGRIEKAVNAVNGVAPKRGGQMPTGCGTEEEFTKEQKALLQSAHDLITRRRKLKAAVVRSNADTTVEVAGEKMTVAEAIERKQSIGYEKTLLSRLKAEYARCKQFVDQQNQQTHEQLLKLLEATYGKEGATVTGSDYDAVAVPFLARYESVLIDPLNVKKRVEELEASIDDFEQGVDIALTESNARTEIEV